MIRRPPTSPLFPSTPLSRSDVLPVAGAQQVGRVGLAPLELADDDGAGEAADPPRQVSLERGDLEDRKSTRLNSSHSQISYAVFCLKKKNMLDSLSLIRRASY